MQFLMYFNCNAKFNIALFAKIQACIRTLDRYQSHYRVLLPWLKIALCRTMEINICTKTNVFVNLLFWSKGLFSYNLFFLQFK